MVYVLVPNDPASPDAGGVDPLFANPHVTAGGRLAAAAAAPILGISDYGETEPASQPEPLRTEVREGIAKGVYPPW
jgi:hypothetical protein